MDNRGVNTLNLFAYCGNNPINNQDHNGHFFFGALVGEIVGGAAGAITALVKGKSVKAGFLTGAAIGLVCDIVATGGMSAAVGVALCGVAAGVGNAVNQYANYRIEKKAYSKSKTSSRKSANNNIKTPRSSNGKLASECESFADYVDIKSIAVSSATAMMFAPASIGANYVVNSAFAGVETVGVTGFVAQFAANFVMGGQYINITINN